MKKYLSRLLASFMVLGVLVSAVQVEAAELGEITIAGHYENPNTGIIEDSGGESSYALGQSMVENMMSTDANLVENEDGTYYLTLEFNLYNYISDIEFQLQNQGDTDYEDAIFEILEEQEETVTMGVEIDNLDSLIRASCYVVPMGRNVVFYITYSDTFDAAIALAAENAPVETDDITTNVETPVEVTTSSDDEVLGLTLSSGLSGAEEQASISEEQNIEVVIDGSFWVLLFVLVFTTNIITGALLIVGCYFIKNKLLVEKENQNDEEEEEEEGMLEMDSFEFEVEEDEEEIN